MEIAPKNQKKNERFTIDKNRKQTMMKKTELEAIGKIVCSLSLTKKCLPNALFCVAHSHFVEVIVRCKIDRK